MTSACKAVRGKESARASGGGGVSVVTIAAGSLNGSLNSASKQCHNLN